MRLICISTLTFLAFGCAPKWADDTAAGDVSDSDATDVDEDDGSDDGDDGDDDARDGIRASIFSRVGRVRARDGGDARVSRLTDGGRWAP